MGAPRMVPMILGQSETTTIAEQAAPDLYLVAVCDVLGFSDLFRGSSDLIKTQKLRAVYEKYLQLQRQVGAFQGLTGFSPWVETPLPVLDAVVFSDTVLFWAPAAGAMETLAMSLCVLVSQALIFGLPLRVGVAFGQCVIDPANTIYIGQPS